MTPASPTPIDRSAQSSPAAPDRPRAEIQRLQADLARMRMYAQALEERCNRLWTYIPDTHGAQDPILPFLALHCSMAVPDPNDAH